MAILKSVVDVNNGNTGWSRSDVLDALETVFANLGWHGGTTKNAVACGCQAPGTYAVGENESWRRAGGSVGLTGGNPASFTTKNRYFYVENDGTTAYRILEQFDFGYNEARSDTDQIYDLRHGLQTGDAIHWAPGGTDENRNLNGLTLDTIYYAIRVDDNYFRLAANATDAANGTYIDLLQGAYTNIASKSSTVYRFRRVSDPAYNNYTIEAYIGDQLFFDVVDGSGGNFFLVHETNEYASNKVINSDNFGSVSYRDMPTNNVGINDVNTQGYIEWNLRGWVQSEDEPSYIPEEFHPSNTDTEDPGTWGRHNYKYASDTHAGMIGDIVLLPRSSNQSTSYYPYWKYTVPASGSREALKLRVYRYRSIDSSSYTHRIREVRIMNVAGGWTAGEEFTIPGSAIGYYDGDYDLKFGTNVSETASNYGDGVASITVTNLGSGSNFYQKSSSGKFAILKLINDASKKYGTTYFGFAPATDNDYQLVIQSGSGWAFMNRNATGAGATGTGTYDFGYFTGKQGLDYGPDNYLPTVRYSGYNTWRHINIATTSTPTAYPMSIRVYRAQAPQDPNFAIIQFTQTINGVIVPHGTITIHKGSGYGTNIWDLDNVFLGSFTQYYTGNREISVESGTAGVYYSYYSSYGSGQEPATNWSKARDAFYGYMRNDSSFYLSTSTYECNIDTNNSSNNNMIYYRNSTFDQYQGNSVDSAANYYRPIKGIPIADKLIPCPYYMPDDFALLQVATTPGLTQFRPGDTVTVSPSEVYEVVLAGYQTQQNGLDNVNNNSTIGMLLLARTV
jgi:hypothetical protein